MIASHERLQTQLESSEPVYGINTGFGSMAHVVVHHDFLSDLQRRLVRSHASGVGEPLRVADTRALMVARLNALAKGYSGVRPAVAECLVMWLNQPLTPWVPSIGSLGASGDLTPLAHVALALIGEGAVWEGDHATRAALEVLTERAMSPLVLAPKEGLALINGTSAMTGMAALVIDDGWAQVEQAEVIAALSLQALRGSVSPFASAGHDRARPHAGQCASAAHMRDLLRESDLARSHADLQSALGQAPCGDAPSTRDGSQLLQDAYSLRCIPQVLGAVRDALRFAEGVVETELNSANDNPLLMPDGTLFHGGNFHGQPVALAMDTVAIALTQLGVMAERRLHRLLNPHLSHGLPEFLTSRDTGLNSGFAGAQYPATALVAENRLLANPSSIQSVPANNDNQDVVSMGLIAARHARRILDNNRSILSIEVLAAAQGVDLRGGRHRLSPATRGAYDRVRQCASFLAEDRPMSGAIEACRRALADGLFRGARDGALG